MAWNHIPQPGEKVRIGRHELTVLDAEPTRVRRIEVVELEADAPTGEQKPDQPAVQPIETGEKSA